MGSDSQAVIDLFEEARRIEMYERLASQQRGHFTADMLGTAVTWDGHASLGWPDGGEIAPGSLADLVTVGFDSPRLAGATGLAGVAGLAGGAAPGGDAGLAGGAAPGGGAALGGDAAPGGSDGLAAAGDGPDLAVLEAVIFAASPADVRNVVIGGRDVVVDRRHVLVEDVPAALADAVRAVLA